MNIEIASALAQTGVTLEVIVRDDSPERSAREVVERASDARVRYAVHEPPTGCPAKVRNAALVEARGRFCHFLDDDDRVLRTLAVAAQRSGLTAPCASTTKLGKYQLEP